MGGGLLSHRAYVTKRNLQHPHHPFLLEFMHIIFTYSLTWFLRVTEEASFANLSKLFHHISKFTQNVSHYWRGGWASLKNQDYDVHNGSFLYHHPLSHPTTFLYKGLQTVKSLAGTTLLECPQWKNKRNFLIFLWNPLLHKQTRHKTVNGKKTKKFIPGPGVNIFHFHKTTWQEECQTMGKQAINIDSGPLEAFRLSH